MDSQTNCPSETLSRFDKWDMSMSSRTRDDISKMEESGVILANLPAYVERSNTSVSKTPKAIMQALYDYFTVNGFQSDIDVIDLKITCMGIIFHEMFKFVVTLFKGNKNQVIVEFQRRFGSSEDFYSIFWEAKQLLQSDRTESDVIVFSRQSTQHFELEKSSGEIYPKSDFIGILCRQIAYNNGHPQSVHFALKTLAEFVEVPLDILEYEPVRTTLSAKVEWLTHLSGKEYIYVKIFAAMASLLSCLCSVDDHHEIWLQRQTEALMIFVQNSNAFSSLEHKVLEKKLSESYSSLREGILKRSKFNSLVLA